MPIRFQVDADFYDHPKSIGLSDAAVALWTRSGSYSAAKLLDGFIAEHVLPTLSRTPDEAAAELVRRGLWRRVKGGYRFHQWSERNLTRARVEGERASDRTRKAETRAAARRAATQARGARGNSEEPQVKPPNVRPDSDRTPTGIQQDSDRNPDVSVSGSVSVSVLGSGRPPDAPPRTCPEHANETHPPRCGECADARRSRDEWDHQRAAEASLARQAEARSRAEVNRLAIAACNLCDLTGRLPGGAICHHDPNVAARATRGAAAARANIPNGRGGKR